MSIELIQLTYDFLCFVMYFVSGPTYVKVEQIVFSFCWVVSPSCCVCEGVWVICCVCNLVIVFMDVSRVWGSYSLLCKMFLVVSFSRCLCLVGGMK